MLPKFFRPHILYRDVLGYLHDEKPLLGEKKNLKIFFGSKNRKKTHKNKAKSRFLDVSHAFSGVNFKGRKNNVTKIFSTPHLISRRFGVST